MAKNKCILTSSPEGLVLKGQKCWILYFLYWPKQRITLQHLQGYFVRLGDAEQNTTDFTG